MPGSIPIENTASLPELDALMTAVMVTDLLLLSRPGDADYAITVQQLMDLVLDGMAPLESPSFNGNPTAPTPEPGDNSDKIATTEFVQSIAQELTQEINTNASNTQAIGHIWPWEPGTNYYVSRTVNDFVTAPDILYHDQSLWLVTQDFTSGPTFAEKLPGLGVVLQRLKMDSDADYLELTAGAQAPLFVNQVLGVYLAIRQFDIVREQTLPNDRIGTPLVYHRALCNTGLTGPCVVTIQRLNASNGTTDTVGTITFTGTPGASGIFGTFAFNDPISPTPNDTLLFARGDTLLFVLTTTDVNLQWIRINMLGTYVSFQSPVFDPGTEPGPGPFVPMVQMDFNGPNGSTTYTDALGRHSPVGYGGALSTAQSVSGGSSFYANQDGRIFVDGYNVDSADFDFTGKDFSIITYIKPISIGNDYVWCKTSGGNIGLNLKLGTNGLGEPVVYLWPMVNGIGATVPDLLTRPGFTKVEVRREADVWSLLIDDVVAASGVDYCSVVGWEGDAGYRGFLVAGAANDNRYSGYIDNFTVGVR